MRLHVENHRQKAFTAPVKRLVFVLAVYQALLHAYFFLHAGDPRLAMPHVVAFMHDLTLFALILLCYRIALRVLPGAARGTEIFFFLCILLCSLFFAVYPRLLREYLVFPVNIFETDMKSAEIFFSEYLGITVLWPVFAALILGITAIFVPYHISVTRNIQTAALILLLIMSGLTLKRLSPQPLISSLQQEIAAAGRHDQRQVPSLTRSRAESAPPAPLLYSPYVDLSISSYHHIVLLVLEGVTSEDFEKEFLTIPDGFLENNKLHAIYFRNYHSTNLDSYTSLIAMLISIQVPYRAYTDARLYDHVNTAPNLVKDLRSKGFYTAFISTYEYQPFVPARNDWDRIYERRDLPSSEQWVSSGSSKMEAATEDKAALSTIVEIAKQHQNSLILHEMVYGHSPDWRAKTGKTQLTYYNEYLEELVTLFSEADLFSTTLLVVVSDHGYRARPAHAENYRVPLLIVGSTLSSAVNNDFFNHLDLQQLIYHYASKASFPISREQILTVGSSEKWVYGKIMKSGDYLFIDDTRGVVLAEHGMLNPGEVQEEFQAGLNEFDRNLIKEQR